MGLLDKLMGGKEPEYPPLDAESTAAKRLEALREPLRELLADVDEPVEVVPAGESLYAFIGKPPKKFGLAWIHEGQVSNMKKLVAEKNLSPIKMERLVDTLRSAYERSGEAPRYKATVAERTVVVTESETLGQEVDQVIREVA